jgi:hypothetical protein
MFLKIDILLVQDYQPMRFRFLRIPLRFFSKLNTLLEDNGVFKMIRREMN